MPPLPPMGAGPGAPPMGAAPLTPPPMATPPMQTMGGGMTAQVRVEINNVVKSLIRILGMLKEVRSEESQAVMKALQALEKVTPDVDEGVSQSEIKALAASAQTAAPGPGARPGANTGAPGGGLGPRPPSPMSATGIGSGGAGGGIPGLDTGGL